MNKDDIILNPLDICKIIDMIKDDALYNISSNALHNTDMYKIVTSHKTYDNNNSHLFSNIVKEDPVVLDQKHAGVCWMCGGMNICRRGIIKKLKLNKKFKLSLNYLIFWDKIERCNYFMRHIIKNKHLGFNSKKNKNMISSPMSDGGYWHTFYDLVEKYGLIPDEIFSRRYSASNTGNLNKLLKYKLREFASILLSPNIDNNSNNNTSYNNSDSDSDIDIDVEKLYTNTMHIIIRILVSMLGCPPYPNSEFSWTYETENGDKKTISNLTANTFYSDFCQTKFDEFITIINDPRKRYPYNQLYEMRSVKYMVKDRSNTKSHMYLNLPFDDLVDLVVKQIDDGIPVWIACDISKYTNHTRNLMDVELYDFGLPFDTNFHSMSKADRLDFSDSYASHVMCITGYDIDNTNTDSNNDINTDTNTNAIKHKYNLRKRKNQIIVNQPNKKQKTSFPSRSDTNTNTNVLKFRVENSWGNIGSNNGIYTMTREWFKEYGFDIVVHNSYLTKSQKELLNMKPFKLDKNDPLSEPIINNQLNHLNQLN